MPGTTFTVFNLNQTPNLETMIIATLWRVLLRIGVLRSLRSLSMHLRNLSTICASLLELAYGKALRTFGKG